jgi:hypothetical protein
MIEQPSIDPCDTAISWAYIIYSIPIVVSSGSKYSNTIENKSALVNRPHRRLEARNGLRLTSRPPATMDSH